MPLSNEISGLTYVNVANGSLRVRENGENATYNSLTGRLISVSTRLDEGNADRHIKPYVRLLVQLDDGERRFMLAARLESTFGWMFASFLGGLSAGELIKVRTWPGSDNDKVSICWIEKLSTEGDWIPAARTIFGASTKHTEALEAIKRHQCHVDPDAVPEAEKFSDDEYDPFADEAEPQTAFAATAGAGGMASIRLTRPDWCSWAQDEAVRLRISSFIDFDALFAMTDISAASVAFHAQKDQALDDMRQKTVAEPKEPA